MIRVTIELVPHGVESRAMQLDIIEIWNDGSYSESTVYGNYQVRDSADRTAVIKEYQRDHGYRDLVGIALDALS